MMLSGQGESRQAEDRRTIIAIVILAVFFVILRFFSRWLKRLSLGLDDNLLLFSLVFIFALLGLNLAMIQHGMGIHADEIPIQDQITIGKLLMAFECVYCTTVGIVKCSILAMYNRVFTTRNFRIISWIIVGVTLSWVIAIICVSIFQCSPIHKAWNPAVPGHCLNLRSSFIGNGVPNFTTDIVILSLPAYRVWKLHASVAHRLSVICIFMLGSFVVFTSIYRFSTLFKFNEADMPWTLAKPCVWCVVEVSSGVISACLPTLRPIFQLFSSRFNSSRGTYPSNFTPSNTGASRSKYQSFDPDTMFRPDGVEAANAVSVSGSYESDGTPLHDIRVQVNHNVKWEVSSVHAVSHHV